MQLKSNCYKTAQTSSSMITPDIRSRVSTMIASLNWPTLEQRRNYLKLIMMCKITKGLASRNIILKNFKNLQ